MKRLLQSPIKSLKKLALQMHISYSATEGNKRITPAYISYSHNAGTEGTAQGRMLTLLSMVSCDHWGKWSGHVGYFLSDEAWFHLSNYVSSRKLRMWSNEQPHVFHKQPLHPTKFGVWCVVCCQHVVKPLFFEVTVDENIYWYIITQFISLPEYETVTSSLNKMVTHSILQKK
jgi:hypothetical protein